MIAQPYSILVELPPSEENNYTTFHYTLNNSFNFIHQNEVAADFWDDVEGCIGDGFQHLPYWPKLICESACVGILFGDPRAFGACIGCHGEHVIGCTINSI